MRLWQRIVDQRITNLIGDGDVSHLSGAGKPLSLELDKHSPDELRLAHKIMADNDVLPDWVAAGKALEELEAKLRKQVTVKAEAFVKKRKSAESGGHTCLSLQNEDRWNAYAAAFREQVGRYNREVLLYNLKLPAGLPHRQILDDDALIDQALSANQSSTLTPEN